MKKYNKLWQCFFAAGLLAIAVQQLICKDFRPVILPPAFPAWLAAARLICTWIFSLALIIACVAIILNIKAREVSLTIGFILLLMVLFFHVPYELSMYPAHLFSWTDPLKDLALSGGAFAVAATFTQNKYSSSFIKFLERLIPYGKYFFGVMLFAFGIDHFLYTAFVVTLVPSWMPFAFFWTYFAGVALMLSALCIIFNIKRNITVALTGLMLFIWFIILHIPRAVIDPQSGNGNEWTSVFEALIFSGIAFLIAANSKV